MEPKLQQNDPGTIRAWAMFDWSNSAYNLVITSTIFPAYYTAITTTDTHGDIVEFFGVPMVNTALANYALAFSYLLMALSLPVLSSIADARDNRKKMMQGFTLAGSLACMGLFYFKLETLEIGIICSMIAAMGYIGGVLFNNSYLPEIASPERQDQVSAQGFSYGYTGSVILQIICFLFVLKPDWFGITDPSLPARISFFLVGVWWLGFSQITFRKLPGPRSEKRAVDRTVLRYGFKELRSVSRRVAANLALKRYLLAFFFYAMGVQTVMLVAAAFGEKTLKLGPSKLIITILLIQLVAIAGAYLMSAWAQRLGNIRVLAGVVVVWIGICVMAYFISTEMQFYILAVLVGVVMGGIQSLSRSTFSKLIPEQSQDHASFFSFYDVTEKIAIVLGLFTFALTEQLTHNIRYSALALSVFFLVGLLLLFRVPRVPVLSGQR